MTTSKHLAANQKWREENPETYKASVKRWRERHGAYCKNFMRERREGLRGPYMKSDGPDWKARNRQHHLEVKRESTNRRRQEVFLEAIAHYGGKCFCCGEKEPVFLALDHIDGGGNQHRKKENISHTSWWAKKHGWPSIFRVACHNCNHAIYRNEGHCPHMNQVA